MELTPLSIFHPPPDATEFGSPRINPIIDQNAVENEVSILSKFCTSISDLFEKSKNYVDQNIDAREVMSNVDKIVENLAKERDKYIPKEKQLNEEVAAFISDLQNEKKNRENVIDSFLKELEDSYNNEIKILNTLQDVGEATAKLEQLAMNFTAIGHKIAEATNLLDETSLKRITLILESSFLASPWIKVGLLSHKNSLILRKIDFCEDEIRSSILLLKTNNLSEKEIINLKSKIELTTKIILDFKTQQSNLTHEIVKEGFSGTENALNRGGKLISDLVIPDIIQKSTGMLIDISTISHGALLAGSIISLAAKVYQVAQSSDSLITLKQNKESLIAEHQKETSHTKAAILMAKLDRLDILERDVSIALTQNVLESVVASLAICASVESLLLAAGVTLGATSALCLSATGIGAAVLGTTVGLGGLAYSAYVNRHEIKHTLATADISSRKLFLEYQLQKETQLYEEAQKTFAELTQSLKILELTMPAAWEQKMKLDALRGETALKQQIHMTHVWNNLTKDLNESVDKANIATNTMNVALPRFKQIQEELKMLSKRQEVENTQLAAKTLTSRFSKYDVYGLMSIRSLIKSGLENDETKSEIKQLMLSHKYPCTEPLLTEQVFDFIMECEQVITQRI